MITIEEFKKKQSNKTRLIGLDLGSKRIGVSICDDHQSIATPYKTINKSNTIQLINELKVIINENNIKGIIIGNPLNSFTFFLGIRLLPPLAGIIAIFIYSLLTNFRISSTFRKFWFSPLLYVNPNGTF